MNPATPRDLPAVNAVLDSSPGTELLSRFRREFVIRAVREALDRARLELLDGHAVPVGAGNIALSAGAALGALSACGPRPVINATGVVLHTGLGRAPLPPEWLMTGYCDLEVSRETGERGDRQASVRPALLWLTGAENALVVNNNAAATLLTIDTLARGREVVIARGQLVEIGGSFRMPDVIAASGARLVEVGTTNKVRVGDYGGAIGPDTGAILLVHPSNYRIEGFTESVDVGELATLAARHRVPLIYDIGSGCAFDTRTIPGLEGEPPEPRVDDAISAGADLVCASGDKLLGGPQCGIIVGRDDLVARLASNPLARALRVGKLTLSALGGCLASHLAAEPVEWAPAVRLLVAPEEEVRLAAEQVAESIRRRAPGLRVSTESSRAAPGSGSLPGTEVRSWAVVLRVDRPERAARRLREHEPGVAALVRADALVLDLRAVLADEREVLAVAVVNCTSE